MGVTRTDPKSLSILVSIPNTILALDGFRVLIMSMTLASEIFVMKKDCVVDAKHSFFLFVLL